MSASPREPSAHPLASTMFAGAGNASAGPSLQAELGLAAGTIVAERYRIEGVIARGGMGAVLRATDRRLDRPVALKVILPALAEDLEAVERLRREALSAARVQHPGIVAVLDVGTCPHPDGRGRLCYLVMELVEGESLAAMAARGPLAPELVVEIGLQALDALAAAHDAGLVHRDLKPANVLVSTTRSGVRVRLADFGLVQLAGSTAHARLTQSGVILGTPLYMAPEQARAEPCDARTDVYALGLVLWTCLTARLPSNADGFASAIVAVLTEELPRADAWSPHVPRGLADVIASATRKDPRERPPSAPALAAALSAARAAAPFASSPPPGHSQPPSAPRPPHPPAHTDQARPASTSGVPSIRWFVLAMLPATLLGAAILVLLALGMYEFDTEPPLLAAPTRLPTRSPRPVPVIVTAPEPTTPLAPPTSEPRAPRHGAHAHAHAPATAHLDPPPPSTTTTPPATSETPAAATTPEPRAPVVPHPPASEPLAQTMEPECRAMVRCCRELSRGYAACERTYTNMDVPEAQRPQACDLIAADFRARILAEGRELGDCPP